MSRRAILTIFCAISMAAAEHDPAKAQGRPEPALANAIVLFGAHWCAPCRSEYRILPALVAAAAPNRLVLAWIDRAISLTRPSGVEVLNVGNAQALAARIGGEGYGLPFAAMVDSDGRVCSVWRKPLRPQDIETLTAKCAR